MEMNRWLAETIHHTWSPNNKRKRKIHPDSGGLQLNVAFLMLSEVPDADEEAPHSPRRLPLTLMLRKGSELQSPYTGGLIRSG